MDITNPSSYNKRDLLLFLQLLHTEGIIEPDAVNKKNPLLKQISETWFNHASTKLSIINGLAIEKPWTVSQLIELYYNLLSNYPDSNNTTQLADTIYAERINELEANLTSSQSAFTELIDRCI